MDIVTLALANKYTDEHGSSTPTIEKVPYTSGFGYVICLANYSSEPIGTVHYFQPDTTLTSSTQLGVQYGSNTTPSTSTTRFGIYVTSGSPYVKVEAINGLGRFKITMASGQYTTVNVGNTSYPGFTAELPGVGTCNGSLNKNIYAPISSGSSGQILTSGGSYMAAPTWKDGVYMTTINVTGGVSNKTIQFTCFTYGVLPKKFSSGATYLYDWIASYKNNIISWSSAKDYTNTTDIKFYSIISPISFNDTTSIGYFIFQRYNGTELETLKYDFSNSSGYVTVDSISATAI